MKRQPADQPAPGSGNPFADFFREELGFEPAAKSQPSGAGKPALSDQQVSVGIERKGRRGKTVTVVTGLRLSPDAREELARELRQACGAGGTVAGEVIEIQGDQRDRAIVYLSSKGAIARRSGG